MLKLLRVLALVTGGFIIVTTVAVAVRDLPNFDAPFLLFALAFTIGVVWCFLAVLDNVARTKK